MHPAITYIYCCMSFLIAYNARQLSVFYGLNTNNMDYKKEAIRQNAEELFANYFVKGMNNKDITSFKKNYKTLYRNVIIPMVEFLIEKQSKLHLDAVSVTVCNCKEPTGYYRRCDKFTVLCSDCGNKKQNEH